ncbi:hypothetical protein [Actinomadura sp. DC4]|uniref:hypothetical protein n=1 Tax=Actinomadura sp. DC4 TaxID=3055069 RepID=UPI0025B1F8A6|nr:hypothetical protein [Actinomadura sp. DC4]MDN3351117.1 hypothetical protein [Actinomadura sp. DC4]
MARVEAVLFLLVLAIGGIAAVTVLAVAVRRAAARAERRLRDALYAWTMTSGWQLYEGDAATSWRHRFAHLSRFQIRRLADGVVHGLPMTAADCHYVTHSTDAQGHSQTHTVNLIVLVARLPGRWPDIDVRGRGLGSRFLRALGHQSAVEIGHAQFDQKFRVETADPRAAYALLSPALVDAHLRGQAPQWSIQGGELMIVEQGRLDPGRIGPAIQRLGWLAETLGVRTW